MFKTKYDAHARVFSDPGSPVKDVLSGHLDAHGNIQLVVAGQENVYDFIQSHKDSTDIHLIMKRFAAGEKDILSQVQGFFADCADMPSTYQEILNAVIAGEETFNRLPIEIKENFGHSFQKWLISMDQPDFLSKMGITPDQAQTLGITRSESTADPMSAPPAQDQVEVPASATSISEE